jgi:hypothetical protein
MGEVIDLHSQPAGLEDNLEFVADCCRFAENIMSEAAVKKKWRFADAEWERLGSDEKLIEAIELEKVRRIRSGQQKRERSQVLITKAPDILDAIATDATASPRHRVDAIKTLDNFCANGPEAAPASDRFIISINLSADGVDHVLHFDKSRTIDANDGDDDPYGFEHLAIAANAAKKPESGSGEPL